MAATKSVVVARTEGEKLYEATRANDAKAVKACLAAGECNIEYRTPKDQWTPLIRAAHDGHVGIVESLLKADADPDAESSLGRTSLHVAAHANRVPVVRLLLDAKADTQVRDIYERTAMDYAKSYGESTEVITMLEGAAKDNTSTERMRRVQRKVNVAVEMAAEMRTQVTGRQAALRRLVASRGLWEGDDKEGADLDALAEFHPLAQKGSGAEGRGSWGGVAAAFGAVRALKALIDEGKVDVHESDDTVGGNTPLHWATLHKRLDSVQLLLGAGADPTKRNREGRSALDIARDEDFPEAVNAMERTPKGRIDAAERRADAQRLRDKEKLEEMRREGRKRADNLIRQDSIRRAQEQMMGPPTAPSPVLEFQKVTEGGRAWYI